MFVKTSRLFGMNEAEDIPLKVKLANLLVSLSKWFNNLRNWLIKKKQKFQYVYTASLKTHVSFMTIFN